MWNLDFFQHARPAAQTGAVADAGLPSLFLDQRLRAQPTCTAPAGKLFKVIKPEDLHLLSASPLTLSNAELPQGGWDKHSPPV